jgi:hypothetical protein
MTALIPPGSVEAQKPFHRFVLPAAHNIGFNNMDSSGTIATKLGPAAFMSQFLTPLLGPLGFVGHLGPIATLTALGTMEATSRNQKDNVLDQLAMGARFFEVRASRLAPSLRSTTGLDDLYFHHKVLTGQTIRNFPRMPSASCARSQTRLLWSGSL